MNKILNYITEEEVERAKANASKLTDLLNSTAVRPMPLGVALTSEHRYLQQQFWTMVEGFIIESADKFEKGYYDGRNEYAVRMAAKIAPLLDKFREEISNEI